MGNERGAVTQNFDVMQGNLKALEARGRNHSQLQRDMNPYENHFARHAGTK